MKPKPGQLYRKTWSGDDLLRQQSSQHPQCIAGPVFRNQTCLVIAVTQSKTAFIDSLVLSETGVLGWTVLHPEFWELVP